MVVDALCKSSALEILMYLCREEHARFTDVQHDLDLNPSIVDRRFSELTEAGVVRKDKGLYHITDRGREVAALIHRMDDDPCTELCEPTFCLGQFAELDAAIGGAAGTWLHDLLRATPGTFFALSQAIDRPDTVLEEQVAMARRWDLVHIDEERYVTTRKGERIATLLDAVDEEADELGWRDTGEPDATPERARRSSD
jgi:DNA-binding HxlR family transcriptional regulator